MEITPIHTKTVIKQEGQATEYLFGRAKSFPGLTDMPNIFWGKH